MSETHPNNYEANVKQFAINMIFSVVAFVHNMGIYFL